MLVRQTSSLLTYNGNGGLFTEKKKMPRAKSTSHVELIIAVDGAHIGKESKNTQGSSVPLPARRVLDVRIKLHQ